MLPKRYGFDEYAANKCEIDEIKEPKNFNEACVLPEKDFWFEAMQEELQAIDENDTWELVDLPADRKTIGCKWV